MARLLSMTSQPAIKISTVPYAKLQACLISALLSIGDFDCVWVNIFNIRDCVLLIGLMRTAVSSCLERWTAHALVSLIQH